MVKDPVNHVNDLNQNRDHANKKTGWLQFLGQKFVDLMGRMSLTSGSINLFFF